MRFLINDITCTEYVVEADLDKTLVDIPTLSRLILGTDDIIPASGSIYCFGRRMQIIGKIMVKLSFELDYITKIISHELIITTELPGRYSLIIGWDSLKKLFIEDPLYSDIMFNAHELLTNYMAMQLERLMISGNIVTSDDIELEEGLLSFPLFFEKARSVTIVNESSDTFILFLKR